MNWYLQVLKKYAVFKGRAGRKEYWFFFLFNLIICFGLAIIDKIIGSFNQNLGMGLLSGIYILAVLIPGIAVSIRRLHDTGKSGWWLLVWLIPFIGTIVMLILMAMKGQNGMNQYGPEPTELAI